MKQVMPLAAAVLLLAACNGTPPSTSTNSMTSAGSTEPAADNIATPATGVTTATPTAAASASPVPTTAGVDVKKWAGRWIGVEGTYLNVTSTGANTASLEMQYDLDNKGTYPATVTPEGLRFTRGGETLLLRPSDGDATGLKWLAGKKNCLTVKSGEGYCRA
ncbi:hypothetical protein [Sphingomonas sp. Mn802worker]|uniref:hypothetical protein n=1 Tax=Sphingomonas sp. Mn802worker TaxID=629773 RepID=UPI00036A92B6|nr:hypothetical protein [Sphingomonas sp. Mn802worker]